VKRTLGPVTRRMLRIPGRLYDMHLGWLLGRRFLRLTHVGRRSGRRYRTVLEVVGPGPWPGEVVVMAGLGWSADWLRNIQALPPVLVEIGRERFQPLARVLEQDEAAAALADYERRNRVVAPVVRRVLSWLVGWRYDGSAAARDRLVKELPLVAFRRAD
jgi:deazaflavin-dependent oxidoreductase (nitroreductase family)